MGAKVYADYLTREGSSTSTDSNLEPPVDAAGCCACAIRTVPPGVMVDAAASVVPPSRTLRRLMALVLKFRLSPLFGICHSLLANKRISSSVPSHCF